MTFEPSIGDGVQLMDIMQIQATLAGYSLVDPDDCEVTPGDGLEVDVASGEARLGGPAESISSQTVSLPDPDADGPRKALVYLDSDGDAQTIGGDPAENVAPEGEERTRTAVPAVPIPDEEFLPLAEVWLEADADGIVEGDISSRRMPFSQGSGSGLNADLVRGDDPYTDSDASNAAPVQSVAGETGDVTIEVNQMGPFLPEIPVYNNASYASDYVHDTIERTSDMTEDRFVLCNEYKISNSTTVDADDFVFIAASESIEINGTLEARHATDGGPRKEPGSGNGDDADESWLSPMGIEEGYGGDGRSSGGSANNKYQSGIPPLYRIVTDPTLFFEIFEEDIPFPIIGDYEPRITIDGGDEDTKYNFAAGGGAGGSGMGNDRWRDGEDGEFPGGGGGGRATRSGDTDDGGYGGAGGDGGGLVWLMAPEIKINGKIDTSGSDGEDGEYDIRAGGGGGGGSGGPVILQGVNISGVSNIDTSGGSGGAAGSDNAGDGADGADGDIVISRVNL